MLKNLSLALLSAAIVAAAVVHTPGLLAKSPECRKNVQGVELCVGDLAFHAGLRSAVQIADFNGYSSTGLVGVKRLPETARTSAAMGQLLIAQTEAKGLKVGDHVFSTKTRMGYVIIGLFQHDQILPQGAAWATRQDHINVLIDLSDVMKRR
jgi:hypothetical protein